jgi:hypothetical protein
VARKCRVRAQVLGFAADVVSKVVSRHRRVDDSFFGPRAITVIRMKTWTKDGNKPPTLAASKLAVRRPEPSDKPETPGQSVSKASLGAQFRAIGYGKRLRLGWLLASVMVCGVSFGASMPYLRWMDPPPLRWQPVLVANLEAQRSLGLLVEVTEPPPQARQESSMVVTPEPAGPMPGPVAPPPSLDASTPFPGLQEPEPSPNAPLESSGTPVGSPPPIVPQSLLPYLCAPGPWTTNQLARPAVPLYFWPPQPPAFPSSTATYSNGNP